jgi:hypothetical protein
VARVFVSYASADRECAGQLQRWLVAEGHEVFLSGCMSGCDGLTRWCVWSPRQR